MPEVIPKTTTAELLRLEPKCLRMKCICLLEISWTQSGSTDLYVRNLWLRSRAGEATGSSQVQLGAENTTRAPTGLPGRSSGRSSSKKICFGGRQALPANKCRISSSRAVITTAPVLVMAIFFKAPTSQPHTYLTPSPASSPTFLIEGKTQARTVRSECGPIAEHPERMPPALTLQCKLPPHDKPHRTSAIALKSTMLVEDQRPASYIFSLPMLRTKLLSASQAASASEDIFERSSVQPFEQITRRVPETRTL